LTLDTGHEYCLSHADSHVFEEYPDKLVHMHLHDAKGKSAHLPLGSADVAVKEKLSAFRRDGTCLIEVKTIAGLEESVQYLKNNNLF
jgi:sugar phosphate isomerase/epimerase